MQRSLPGILDKSLSKGKNEINLSTFALLFSEMVKYQLNKVNSVQELQDRLSDYGKFVGTHMLDLLVLREKSYKRDIKVLNALMFVRGPLWKNLFNKEADKLERSNDDPCKFILIEKEPIVNSFISLPKDKHSLNCAAFTAGIVEAFLTGSNFPCKVSAHWHQGTAYIIEFQPEVISRENAVSDPLNKLVEEMHKLRLFRRHQRTFYRLNSSTNAVVQTVDQPSSSDSISQIKLIPKDLHKRLFGETVPSNYLADEEADSWISKLPLPPLLTNNGVFDHVTALGKSQFQPYEELFNKAMSITDQLPQRPAKWEFAVGWTKYNSDGSYETVDAPADHLLFFDIETCVPDGQLPTLAVALSPTNWYSWCSDRLVNLSSYPSIPQLHHMIPLVPSDSSSEPRLVIGHNVGYDRSRVREQFYRQASGTRFWDTMSMSIAYQGMAEHQRLVYEKKDGIDTPIWTNDWRRRACKNSLADVYRKLYPDAPFEQIDKSCRSYFLTEPIEVIQNEFQKLTDYCANDVLVTCKVHKKLYPRFIERFPNLITNVGMMIMANAYLPVTANWRLFYEESERKTQTINNVTTVRLSKMAHTLAEELSIDDKYKNDPWMWTSDWKATSRNYPNIPVWLQNIFAKKMLCTLPTEELQSGDIKLKCMEIARLFGLCYGPYPLFYKRDFGWGYLGKPAEGTEIKDNDPVLLRIVGEATMPTKRIVDLIEQNEQAGYPSIPVDVENEVALVGVLPFYRLKHPKGEGLNVGSPFSKDFHSLFHDEILRATRFPEELQELLKSGTNTRFWGNYRDRYNEQVVAWFNEDGSCGAIAPAVIPSGTITRRAVHKLWLTSTNAKEEMIGSQLKSMIECPAGYKLVGADVDSQEQWLAAIFGDSLSGSGHVGSTPFSQMQLAGNKNDGTDLHSVVAKEVMISRSHAKTLNYARLYGSGQLHASEFLKSQGLSVNDAQEKSAKLFESTKGKKMSYLELNPLLNEYFEEFMKNRSTSFANKNKGYMYIEGRYFVAAGYDQKLNELFEDWLRHNMQYNQSQVEAAPQEIDLKNTDFRKIVYKSSQLHTLYTDGYESDTFNFLEIRARSDTPRTPVLGCRLTTALEPLESNIPGAEDFASKYKRTKINWLVQSSAVDYLHMLLVCMQWMCQEMEIEARFVISVHDEVRYMVPEHEKYRAAIALNVSNMLVRAAISEKLGIRELPMSIAFFSQVDIDTNLRKEVNMKITMPDGQDVPDGEALTMQELLEMMEPTCIDSQDSN
ncbi:Mitochondrial DNA polymerase catalytic subunit [Aphelenchoides besseyi]|nr:Mitochondrial DNA polymerase catalytic subunit [Aphelenchoides besseyi]